MKKNYLGLDIGTDSIGWAVTDEQYNLKKFHGEPMWGSVLFEAAQTKAERRSYRTSRRRVNRRIQRVRLLQELFAVEIGKVDPNFFKRIQESALFCEDKDENYSLFSDEHYTDREYHKAYPTIHHLIVELMGSDEPHDIRLVYLACAWLVAHRGHFLSEVSKENIGTLFDFYVVYKDLEDYILGLSDDYSMPWSEDKAGAFKDILPQKLSITAKSKKLKESIFHNGKVPKDISKEVFPYNCEVMLKLLCGATIKAKDLFDNSDYEEMDSFSLAADDETITNVITHLGEDGELIRKLKAVYDWSVLIDVLNGKTSISQAKVQVYEQHKMDLRNLKYLVKKYMPDRYNEVFRSEKEGFYSAYVKHQKDEKRIPKTWSSVAEFSATLKGLLKDLEVEETDKPLYMDMMERISNNTFLPKQKNTDNRVIPHQLYWYELNQILVHACRYLPFLASSDESGISISDKILSVFTFRIPYYVGPLNEKSNYAWIIKKSDERIFPWNFDQVVDLDKSEDEFIRRMVNSCSYLLGEKCLPKESLLYRKYMVLNEINNIRINDIRISVELKQDIYRDLFCSYRKVSRKRLEDYLLSNGYIENRDQLSGIDIQINAFLTSYHDFARLLKQNKLTVEDAERIIERRTYTEDRRRYVLWLRDNYPKLSEEDIRYLSKLRYKEFGRLSGRFLNQLEGEDAQGNTLTIMSALWNSNHNLSELLSDSYSFRKEIERINNEYYSENPANVEQRLDEMYISASVKRPVLRALEVTREVTKALGKAPDKIFIEMTRGASKDQKNRRTMSRRQQLIDLYNKIDTEDVRILQKELNEMGEMADNRLQSDKLFLYYMQLGRSIYSGERIDINQLASNKYDIDHIYPQSMVKDDSLLNNRVLCLSEENGSIKKDHYPVPAEWRRKQRTTWEMLKRNKLITEEKYRRLIRETGFTDEEKIGFINRQLTETSQSTKAVSILLKELYPEAEIVYVKARLTTEFRNEFDMLKSRSFNELHHAKDAYLNIVTGNVYDARFSKRWFSLKKGYSLKTKTIFGNRPWTAPDGEIVWDGSSMLQKVKKTVGKNNAHLTQYAFCRQGKLFDINPVKKDAELIPRKNELAPEKYGGYNKTTASFFVLVKYKAGKKSDLVIVPVELLYADRFTEDSSFAAQYAKEQILKNRKVKIDEIEFPLGSRRLKINTMFSADGFRFVLASKDSGGKMVAVSPMMAFSGNVSWQNYLHHVDSFANKTSLNKNLVYDEEHDKVSVEKNIELYDLYTEKLTSSIYAKRPGNPFQVLLSGRELFCKLDIKKQIKAIQSIHQVFGRVSGGVDLTDIGGKNRSATTRLSATISNWKKLYKEVYIIDSSVTGLWEKSSDNLLKLL